tara:strand:- start:311 stop:448 length:138 start_codon:yes stop_codon:yes gene_type:complete
MCSLFQLNQARDASKDDAVFWAYQYDVIVVFQAYQYAVIVVFRVM